MEHDLQLKGVPIWRAVQWWDWKTLLRVLLRCICSSEIADSIAALIRVSNVKPNYWLHHHDMNACVCQRWTGKLWSGQGTASNPTVSRPTVPPGSGRFLLFLTMTTARNRTELSVNRRLSYEAASKYLYWNTSPNTSFFWGGGTESDFPCKV